MNKQQYVETHFLAPYDGEDPIGFFVKNHDWYLDPGYYKTDWLDHMEVFSQEGKPQALVSHNYELVGEDLEQALAFAKNHGCQVSLMGDSWYHKNCFMIMLEKQPVKFRVYTDTEIEEMA